MKLQDRQERALARRRKDLEQYNERIREHHEELAFLRRLRDDNYRNRFLAAGKEKLSDREYFVQEVLKGSPNTPDATLEVIAELITSKSLQGKRDRAEADVRALERKLER